MKTKLILGLLFFSLIVGCSKDDSLKTDSQLSIEIGEGYSTESLYFIVTSPSTHELIGWIKAEKGNSFIDLPKSLESIDLHKLNLYDDGWFLIESYFGIKPEPIVLKLSDQGGDRRGELIKTSFIKAVNTPAHSLAITSGYNGNWGLVHSNGLNEPFIWYEYQNQNHKNAAYIILENEEGASFKVFDYDSFTANEIGDSEYEIDLEVMNNEMEKVIFSGLNGLSNLFLKVDGFDLEDFEASYDRIVYQLVNGSEIQPSDLYAWIPTNQITEYYATEIYGEFDGFRHTNYRVAKDLNSEFEKIDLSFDVFDASVKDFEMETTGESDLDQVSFYGTSGWAAYSISGEVYFPTIPEEMENSFPYLKTDLSQYIGDEVRVNRYIFRQNSVQDFLDNKLRSGEDLILKTLKSQGVNERIIVGKSFFPD